MSNLEDIVKIDYYGYEANRKYLSCSQFEDYLSCEAAALAKEQRRFERKKSDAFLVGNYFHTALESKEAHAEFCEANFDDIFKTKTVKGELVITGKYAPFVKADEMLNVAFNDENIKRLIDADGENEVTMIGKLFGQYPWKIRLDKYIPNTNMIIDWKTVANIWELSWSDTAREKVPFVDTYKYFFRAAVYMEIFRQFTGKKYDPAFLLVCISKQEPPDKEIIGLNDRERLDMELEIVSEKIGRVWRVKTGAQKPTRCGVCDYCRGTKRLEGITEAFKLYPKNRDQRANEYADLILPFEE